MRINRRQALTFAVGAGTFAISGNGFRPAKATPADVKKLITRAGGGRMPSKARLMLKTPEIAENGSTVPISVQMESAMTDGDLVESITVFADGNANPDVITFRFTDLSGSAAAATRIRLARTQNVVAVAKMADGSTYMDSKLVKVTIGCGD